MDDDSLVTEAKKLHQEAELLLRAEDAVPIDLLRRLVGIKHRFIVAGYSKERIVQDNDRLIAEVRKRPTR